jgi:hypothetical protein
VGCRPRVAYTLRVWLPLHILPYALAQDPAGPVAAPGDADLGDPALSWSPTPLAEGWSTAFQVGYARRPLATEHADGADVATEAILGDVVGATVSATLGFRRFGLGLSLPVVVSTSGARTGPGLASPRLTAPIALIRGTALNATATPYVLLPAAGTGAFAPSAIPTGGVAAALGWRHAALSVDGSVQAGFARSPSRIAPDLGLQAGLGWRATDAVAFRAELSVRATLYPGASPGATASGWVQWKPAPSLRLQFGGGPGFGKAPGTPSFFGHASLAWSPGKLAVALSQRGGPTLTLAAVDPDGHPVRDAGVWLGDNRVATADINGLITVPSAVVGRRQGAELRATGFVTATIPSVTAETAATVTLVPASVPLRVRVNDGDKPATNFEIEFRGPFGVKAPPLIAGLDGYAAAMRPGMWTLLVHAGDRSQEREIFVEPGRTTPMQVDVTLGPVGPAHPDIRVVDFGGAPIEGATVTVDGVSIGTTGSGGSVRVRAAEGKHRYTATAEGYHEAHTESAGEMVTLRAPYADGALVVSTLGPDARPVDATVRFEGPQRLAPARLGADGRGVFYLAPGTWTLYAESPAFSPQRRALAMPAQSEPGAIDLPILLRASEGGAATLDIRVVDPDGTPVRDARVTLDDAALGTTGSGGTLAIGHLKPTLRRITVAADGFAEAKPEDVQLAAGYQEHTLMLPYPEGTVEVTATDPEGKPTDVMIRLAGPTRLPPRPLGADGRERLQLAPGRWQLLASSAAFGNQTREIVVPAGASGLIRVDLKMRSTASGHAELRLAVVGPDGVPVDGAQVVLDGDAIGTTSNTGQLQTAGLVAGTHELRVSAPAYQELKSTISLRDGAPKVSDLSLKYARGATRLRVRVVAGATETPLPDAVVRLTGPRNLPPLKVDANGERLLSLEPGDWQALISSEQLGLQQKSFTITSADGLQQVPLLLAPGANGDCTLLVRVSDPSGQPIRGAAVTIKSESGVTSPGGAALLTGLPPGPAQLAVSAPGFIDAAPATFALSPGSQTQFITLDYRRQETTFTVVDAAGRPIEARLSFTGPEYVASRQTGEDGTDKVPLRPGSWTVDIEGESGAPTTATVVVPVDAAPAPITIKLNK